MEGRNPWDGSCGAPSSLVQLSKHFTLDQAHQNDGLRLRTRDTVAAPSTFHMGALLEETTRLSNVNQTSWANEFRQSHPEQAQTQSSRDMVDQFKAEMKSQNTTTSLPEPFPSYPVGIFSQHRLAAPFMMSAPVQSNWAEDALSPYDNTVISESALLDSATPTSLLSDPRLRQAAADLSRSVIDDRIRGTEFMRFVQDIAGGDQSTSEQGQSGSESVDHRLQDELNEMRRHLHPVGDLEEERIWDRFAQALDEWGRLAQMTQFGVEEPGQMSGDDQQQMGNDSGFILQPDRRNVSAYEFMESNPLLDSPADPFELGLHLLTEGHISEAVLAFEAAVQRNASHAVAWQWLAVTLSENEEETKAEIASYRCLDLDPTNRIALLSLARNHANNGNQEGAIAALHRWIAAHPAYRSITSSSGDVASHRSPLLDAYRDTRFVSRSEFNALEELLLRCVAGGASSLDSELQTALGILYHMDSQFDKAVDCFEAALRVEPYNALLWNKLGAALANASKDEKAVAAYRRALELAPGFVRARCNLGIACSALGAYREAVEHALVALMLQSRAKNRPLGAESQSRTATDQASIWTLLSTTAVRMHRPDLMDMIRERQADRLFAEFGISDVTIESM